MNTLPSPIQALQPTVSTHTSSSGLETLLTTLLILLPTLLLTHHIRNDYKAFLALGPGGTPSTPTGYLRISILRLFAVRNPLSPPSLPTTLHPQTGILNASSFPSRRGPRPIVAGIAPQRQITQRSSSDMYAALSTAINNLEQNHRDLLYTGTSCFEKNSTGIFCYDSTANANTHIRANTSLKTGLNPSINTNPPQQQPPPPPSSTNTSSSSPRRTCNGEVCHSHPSDGSLHLTLHPADVKLVLERGWGQRHPLARESWWWWARIVPPGFVMVYAPRNEQELESVLEIIRAAGWWVSGMEI